MKRRKTSKRMPEQFFTIKRKSKTVDNAIRGAAEYLKIDLPTINYYPYVFSSPHGGPGQGCCDKAAIVSGRVSIDWLTTGISFHEQNKIMASYFDPLCGEAYGDVDIIFTLLHELRHFWQYKYEREKYYGMPNAVTEEDHLSDISEIDADAFALAYGIFVLGYKNEEIPMLFQAQYGLDKGKRKKRAQKIFAEFKERGLVA